MSNKNIEMIGGGLVCDNCTWEDLSISIEDYKDWVDKSCPLCGSNLLTKEDFINSEELRLLVEFTNTLSKEDLDELTKDIDVEEIKKSLFLKDAKGLDLLSEGGTYALCVNTHRQTKVTKIEKL